MKKFENVFSLLNYGCFYLRKFGLRRTIAAISMYVSLNLSQEIDVREARRFLKGKGVSDHPVRRKIELPHVKICLNLGCGEYPFSSSEDEKWFNIDMGKTGDLVLDVRYTEKCFDPKTVDYVFCSHLLEHLTYREGDKLLRDIWDLLKDGGVLELHLPEFGMIIVNQDAHIEGIYGGQRDEYDVHKSGWDYYTGKPHRRDLKTTLEEIGFSIVKAERHKPAQIGILCSKGETNQRLEWRKTWAMEMYDIIKPLSH